MLQWGNYLRECLHIVLTTSYAKPFYMPQHLFEEQAVVYQLPVHKKFNVHTISEKECGGKSKLQRGY